MDLNLGERMLLFRKEQGKSRRELSELSGVSESAIKQYETGKRQPRLEQLQKIAVALEVSLGELLQIDDERLIQMINSDDKVLERIYHNDKVMQYRAKEAYGNSVQVPKKYSIRIDTSKTVDLAPIFKRADNGTLTDEDRKILEEQRKKLPEAMERFAATWKKIDDILSKEDTDNAET